MTGIQPVALPDSFTDPALHSQTYERAVAPRLGERLGGTWRLVGVDLVERRAYFSCQVDVVSINDERVVALPDTVKPADGAAQAALLAEMYEARHPGEGWVMIGFDPHGHRATMGRLDPDELRAREALAAALGVRPWEVRVRGADGGGFDVDLPPSYVPSRHDARLGEAVTTVIGRPGWYLRTDAAALTMRIRPGELPTFPAAIPYPLDSDRCGIWSLPIGRGLGGAGEPDFDVKLDFDATPGLLTTGTAGSGKSVFIDCLIASCLARGWELAVVTVPHKAVDYTWCKNLCRPGGWGCDSKEQALAVLRLIYEEGQHRAGVLSRHGAQKIQDLPARTRPAPLLVVVDEVTGLFALEPVPKGVPKDHPLVVEALTKNLVTQTLISTVNKLPAEMRFVGIRVALSTQMAQANTNVSVPLKMNLANRVLLGANPNDTARGHALLDPRSVPRVPEWIRSDETASRGVGVAELEGKAPCVMKGYWARVEELGSWLLDLGVPRSDHPEPDARDIARLTPSLDDTADSPRALSRLEIEGGFGDVDDTTGADGLKGAARAAHELAASAAAASRRPATGRGSR